MAAGEWNLCKDLLRFLHSVDESGLVLRQAIKDLRLFEKEGIEIDEIYFGAPGTTELSFLPPPPPPPTTASSPVPRLPRPSTPPLRPQPATRIISPTPRRPLDLPSFPIPSPSVSLSSPSPSTSALTSPPINQVRLPLFTRSSSSSASTSQVGLGSLLYLSGSNERNGSSANLVTSPIKDGEAVTVASGGSAGRVVDRASLFRNSSGTGSGTVKKGAEEKGKQAGGGRWV